MNRKHEIAKLCLDGVRITFGGAVLVRVVRYDVPNQIFFPAAGIVIALLIVIALILMKDNKKDKDNNKDK